MKKDQNSDLNQIDKQDQSLPRSKILRGRKNFQRLFEKSRVIKTPSVHLRYRIYEDSSEGCQIGFIVKKKLGNAAKRNRIKRWLREAYRTQQYHLSDLFEAKAFGFHGVFMIQHVNVDFQTIREDVSGLLKKMRGILQNHLDSKLSVHDSKKVK
jgi:ribonuclease P protein component